MEIAIRTAIEKLGVSVGVISGDTALKDCPASNRIVPAKRARPVIRPSDAELQQAAEILNRAERVTILGGAGCEGAHAELLKIAETLQSPIVHALRGKEFIEYDIRLIWE
jgi:pyruvate dehydrogenase (quinone)